jgi:hypothetical protein
VISAGNDLVDLALTDPARSCLPRFYTKVLSPGELSRFEGGDFHRYLWRCWSVKESAYKFVRRSRTDLVFSPTKIDVAGDTVWIAGVTLFVRSWITDVIDTIVHDSPDFSSVVHERALVPATVRGLALERLHCLFPGRTWTIGEGIPTAVSEDLRLPLSFSHHGAYVGYSLVCP